MIKLSIHHEQTYTYEFYYNACRIHFHKRLSTKRIQVPALPQSPVLSGGLLGLRFRAGQELLRVLQSLHEFLLVDQSTCILVLKNNS